jgi:hypothetical protein
VTIIAGITARYMCWVLAGCCHTIMAGTAASDDLRMVHDIHRSERVRVVTILTHSGGLNVRWVFPGGVGAIVTVHAVTRDVRVTEIRRQPANSGMAVVTVFATGDMCRSFSGGRYAIMTGTAGSQYLRVINCKRGCPDIRIMAILANIS